MFGFMRGPSGPTPEELKKYKAEGASFIDVRTPGEWDEGHIEGATLIPLQIIAQNVEKIKSMPQPILTYCRSGARAGQATNFLSQHGIEVYNAGGIGDLSYHLNS